MKKEDRELLERAAKAAGLKLSWVAVAPYPGAREVPTVGGKRWDPLTDDGDALRLAVKLGIETLPDDQVQESQTAFTVGRFGYNTWEEWKDHRGDACSAMRRAIVRAAAQIGAACK